MQAAAEAISIPGVAGADPRVRNPGAWALAGSAATAPQRLSSQWDELAAQAAEPNAFAERWFLEASVRNLAPPADLRLIEVWQGDLLIGLLPIASSGSYGRLPVRHLRNWSHSHSFLGTPLVRGGFEPLFWEEVLLLLDRQRWASGFLHISNLAEDGPVHRGLVSATLALGRRCDTVHRMKRALLQSDLSPQNYYERTVRKKKRKELKRLSDRLAELGQVDFRTAGNAAEVERWSDEFLELERSGWKGEAGSALACGDDSAVFFKDALAAAFRAGRLEFLRLDHGGRPIAMLVNFLTPPGSFSFKTAIDEDYARFSPGVLIQLRNLRVLDRAEVGWMDSCAAEDHPMIDSLWAERRPLVRVTVALAGAVRGVTFRFCRLAENASAAARRLAGSRAPLPEGET